MDEASRASSFSKLDPNDGPRSPSHTPQLLQNHLYEAFLAGETTDISLRITGIWNTVYRLHRIVLTQAGFFRSLFTSGFKEGLSVASFVQGEVRLSFHDPNITRPAFEICLARLYGGGPSLQPISNEPLTTAYTRSWTERPPEFRDQQPSSPRFLLSLLSTAFYLSIPTVASEALHLILLSIGPTTVIRYLDYALGNGIGPADAGEPERAVTLENIGQDIDSASILTTQTETSLESHDLEGEDSQAKSGEVPASSLPIQPTPNYSVGILGNKIGEACAAFLTRWGVDLFLREEESTSSMASPRPIYTNQGTLTSQGGGASTNMWRPAITVPRIWAHDLPSEWVYGVISSDEFFIRNEKTRYDVAKRVVELRRKHRGMHEADEVQYRRLFEEGIYYSHLSWDELVAVAEDRSPSTGGPYVSLARIQAAHWSSDMLKRLITTQDTLGSTTRPGRPGSQEQKGLELNLKVSSTRIHSTEEARNRPGPETQYFPVPTDTSLRIGDPGTTSINEDLFNSSASRSAGGLRTLSATNFFGIGHPRRTRNDIQMDPDPGKSMPDSWVAYEPFRFSVEFWEVTKERARVYSQTIWYAGSCYNVYTQAVRKKGLQLQIGVYLHRQSNVDPIPAASAPRVTVPSGQAPPSAWTSSPALTGSLASASSSTTALPMSRPHARSMPSSEPATSRGNTPAPISRSPPQRSTTPLSVPRSPRLFQSGSFSPSTSPSALPNTPLLHPSIGLLGGTAFTMEPPNQPYRDPRPAISAYFSIACHSSTGSSLTRFSSAPDTFAVSQSWGWKSSTLDVGESNDEQGGQESSLRATVVIGLV